MKAIVLCGGVPQIALLNELRNRGIETVLLDMNEKVKAREYADKFYPVSVLDVEAVEAVAVSERADFIITVCADQVLSVVAQLSEELGLPCYIDYQTAKNVSDKQFMKRIFAEHKIPTSKYVVSESYTDDLADGMDYPLIVKPVDSYSSRGVRKVANSDELRSAFENAINISRTHMAIVEEFVSGKELSVDVYVENGKAHVLCISQLDKIPGADRFVINRCSFPAPITDKEKKMVEAASQQIAEAFGLFDSPMLVQLITTGDKISILEFCARTGGGDKFRLIKKATGFDVVKAVVDLTLGGKPHVKKSRYESKLIVDEFLYCVPGIFDHLEGFDSLLHNGVISEYFQLKQPGSELKEPSSSGDRVAYYTIQADSTDDLNSKRKIANATVRAVDVNGADLLRHDLIEHNN